MRVTNSPNAPYHSIYLGAPISAPSSMKSKSRTKFNEAIMTTKTLKPMLNKEVFAVFIIDNPEPKILMIKLMRYIKAIPPVAATTPNLKFSVGFISPDL